MKKLLLPQLVSLILISSFSNAEITSYDERFTLLCEIESSTGFNWSNGNWHRTHFIGGQKYIIKKQDDVKSSDDEDFDWSNNTHMCGYRQEGEDGGSGSIIRDSCYMIKEFGEEESSFNYQNCRETWRIGTLKVDEDGNLISDIPTKLRTVSCQYRLPKMIFKPNGLIHIWQIGSLKANPEAVILDGVTKIPADYKDSMYIGFGRCSTI